jgi:hypothetical protein
MMHAVSVVSMLALSEFRVNFDSRFPIFGRREVYFFAVNFYVFVVFSVFFEICEYFFCVCEFCFSFLVSVILT